MRAVEETVRLGRVLRAGQHFDEKLSEELFEDL